MAAATARVANSRHSSALARAVMEQAGCQLPSRPRVNRTIVGRSNGLGEIPAQLTKIDPAPVNTVTGP